MAGRKDGGQDPDLGNMSTMDKAGTWATHLWINGFQSLAYPQPGETPCVRDAFYNGFLTAAPMGVLSFLHTKNVHKGYRASVFTFIFVGLGTWEYCKYGRQKQKEINRATIDALNAGSDLPAGVTVKTIGGGGDGDGARDWKDLGK